MPQSKAPSDQSLVQLSSEPLRSADLLPRVGFLAASLFLFGVGFRIFPAISISNLALIMSLLCYVGAFGLLIAVFVRPAQMSPIAQVTVACLLIVGAITAVAYENLFANPSYGTDAIAFAHVGSEILLEGKNPYEVANQDLGPLIERFGVPEIFVTRTLEGGSIDRLITYPALHTAIYAGFVALGVPDLRWVTLVFEILGLAIIWVVASPTMRWLLPVAFLVEPNLVMFFTSGGVTDWLWVVPLIITALMLHRGKTGWAGIALGLACAIKQHPWFIVPFAAIWVAYREDERHGPGEAVGLAPIQAALRFLGVVILGFAIPNLPFLVWSPEDWIRGVLGPIPLGLIPDGQGLSILSAQGILDLSREAQGLMALAIFGLLVLVYLLFFKRLRNALWVLPPLVLFASYRSLHSYFIFWIPVAALWLDLEVRDKTDFIAEENSSLDHLAVWAIPLAFLMGTGLALLLNAVATTGDQERLAIQSVSPTLVAGVLEEIQVEVSNPTDYEVRVIFDLLWVPYPRRWIPENDDLIAPNATEVFTLRPPHTDAVPPRRVVGVNRVQTVPFRVRVNPAGEARFTTSAVLQPEPHQLSG